MKVLTPITNVDIYGMIGLTGSEGCMMARMQNLNLDMGIKERLQ